MGNRLIPFTDPFPAASGTVPSVRHLLLLLTSPRFWRSAGPGPVNPRIRRCRAAARFPLLDKTADEFQLLLTFDRDITKWTHPAGPLAVQQRPGQLPQRLLHASLQVCGRPPGAQEVQGPGRHPAGLGQQVWEPRRRGGPAGRRHAVQEQEDGF